MPSSKDLAIVPWGENKKETECCPRIARILRDELVAPKGKRGTGLRVEGSIKGEGMRKIDFPTAGLRQNKPTVRRVIQRCRRRSTTTLLPPACSHFPHQHPPARNRVRHTRTHARTHAARQAGTHARTHQSPASMCQNDKSAAAAGCTQPTVNNKASQSKATTTATTSAAASAARRNPVNHTARPLPLTRTLLEIRCSTGR